MKHMIVLALSLSVLGTISCKGDDGDDGNDDTETEALLPQIAGALGKVNRPSPAPEARIDRAGRPAITAALISTFTPDARQADVERYNTSGNANPAFLPLIEKSLGVLDGLDRRCGNQLLAGADPAQRYRALARALNDDQLYVQSDRTGVSSVYLGVEAEAVDALMPGQGSGGGRIPGDDVIARSYSVLVAGTLSGLDDGVEQDDAVHDIDVFPFLAAPQQ